MNNIADITMCSSNNCPIRASCYRTKANSDKWQNWCNFEYTCNENNGFSDYIPINPKKNDNIIKANCRNP